MKIISTLALSAIITASFSLSAAETADQPYENIGIPTVTAVNNVMPHYPYQAIRHLRAGSVDVEYSVNIDGRAENIQVIDTNASARFILAVKRALAQTQFAVYTEAGQPVRVDGQQRSYSFEVISGSDDRRGEVLISMR